MTSAVQFRHCLIFNQIEQRVLKKFLLTLILLSSVELCIYRKNLLSEMTVKVYISLTSGLKEVSKSLRMA